MYDPEITQRQLAAVEQRLVQEWMNISGRRDFSLQRHSLDEVRTANSHFKSLLNDEGQLTRELTLDERRWVMNEDALCRWDFRYWMTHYHHIQHWDGASVVLMEPNIPQSIILDLMSECERNQWAIAMLILKARQEGVTTEMQAAVLHRVQFHLNVFSVVGSSRPEKSRLMVDKSELSLANQPWFLKPAMTSYRAGELIEFGSMNSSISIQHGAKVKSGMARGSTPSVVHLSEVAEYLKPEEDIDSSMIFAMHESPNMFLVLESTAKGMKNWWHKKWLYSKEYWGNPQQPSLFQPVFLPWYIAHDIYPTESWLRKHPVPKDWQPSALALRHAERAKDYVRHTPLLRHYMGQDWTLPKHQLWYWEVVRTQYDKEGMLNKFYSELCADDIEAFQVNEVSVFDAETVMLYNEHRAEPVAIFGVDGPDDEIRPKLKPDVRQIDPNIPPIPIDNKYRLVPLRRSGYPVNINPEGKIFIWEMPKDDIDYGIGVDTSQGVGQDRSVIEVMRKATITNTARQCAEFASPWVSAADLFPFVHCVARLYTRRFEGDLRQPLLVIETNNGGDACQLAMRKAGWGRFHQWLRYDKKIIDASRATFLGASTNSWSRELVIGWLVKALKDYMLDIDSPWFVEEMGTLSSDERQRIGALLGAHDDRIMALGWAFLSLHALDNGKLMSPLCRGRIQLQREADEVRFATRPKSSQIELPVADDTLDRLIVASRSPSYANRPLADLMSQEWSPYAYNR